MNKNYYCVIDTETVNGIIDKNGKLDLSQSLVYDVGWCICDKKGNIVMDRSYIVKEIFKGFPDLMQSGYYANKLPMYYEELRTYKRFAVPLLKIWALFLRDCEHYNVKAVMAYNARFDYNSLNNTLRYLTKSKYRYFIPKRYEIWDIMKMVQSIIAKRKSYVTFCETNGFLTAHKKPRPQIKVETLYRYIKPNCVDFVESHTGLEDAKIECEIFAYCERQHKKMKRKLFDD